MFISRSQRPGDPDNIGHFFLAIDPKMFRPEGAFEDDLDAIIDELHHTPASDPALPVLVAGEPESTSFRERSRNGVPIPPTLAERIRGVCERCSVPFLLA